MIGKSIKLAALAAAFAFTAVGGALAVDLKWAHVYAEGTAFHKWSVWAADQIKAKTDGRVNITVYPTSSLGNESDINEGLSIGSVDIIWTGPNFAERDYGPIAISDYPFMLKNYRPLEGLSRQRPVQGTERRLQGSDRQRGRRHHLVRLSPRHLELPDPEARRHEGPQDPRAELADDADVPECGWRQPDPDRLRRGLSGAAAGRGRCRGEPAADHPGR